MNAYQVQATAIANDVWGNAKDAEAFMQHPHALLENQSPLEVASTEAGAKRVIEILEKLRWGLPR